MNNPNNVPQNDTGANNVVDDWKEVAAMGSQAKEAIDDDFEGAAAKEVKDTAAENHVEESTERHEHLVKSLFDKIKDNKRALVTIAGLLVTASMVASTTSDNHRSKEKGPVSAPIRIGDTSNLELNNDDLPEDPGLTASESIALRHKAEEADGQLHMYWANDKELEIVVGGERKTMTPEQIEKEYSNNAEVMDRLNGILKTREEMDDLPKPLPLIPVRERPEPSDPDDLYRFSLDDEFAMPTPEPQQPTDPLSVRPRPSSSQNNVAPESDSHRAWNDGLDS